MAINRGADKLTDHYLDDFIHFRANYQSCDNSLNIFNKTCDLAGFERQESKGTLPDQQILSTWFNN